MRPPGALASLVAIAVLAAGCGSGVVATTSTVPPPPVSSSPEVVVRAWIDAVNAGDEPAGRVLSTPAFADADRNAGDRGEAGWFANTLSISGLEVGAPVPGRELAGNRDFAQVVIVPVAFVLEQKREISFRDGVVQWGFVLVRDRDGQRWRINEQGLRLSPGPPRWTRVVRSRSSKDSGARRASQEGQLCETEGARS